MGNLNYFGAKIGNKILECEKDKKEEIRCVLSM